MLERNNSTLSERGDILQDFCKHYTSVYSALDEYDIDTIYFDYHIDKIRRDIMNDHRRMEPEYERPPCVLCDCLRVCGWDEEIGEFYCFHCDQILRPWDDYVNFDD